MKVQKMALSLVLTILASGTAIAVGPGRSLEFKESPMGVVVFDGAVHKNAGFKCSDCHNPDTFPKMKQGTVKINMNDIYAGKFCGKCHVSAKENCTRCHKKDMK